MVKEEFDVYIQDTGGNEILAEKVTTQENGFMDLWLPRDQKYIIKIEHGGKMVESEISTFDGDATCITTMQLR